MQKGSTFFCIQWHLEPFCFHHSKFDHCYFSYNRKAQTEVMVIYLWILCQIAIGLTVRTSVKGQRGYAQDFSHRQPVVLFSRHSWISGYFLTTWPCIILYTLTSHEFIDKRTIFLIPKCSIIFILIAQSIVDPALLWSVNAKGFYLLCYSITRHLKPSCLHPTLVFIVPCINSMVHTIQQFPAFDYTILPCFGLLWFA